MLVQSLSSIVWTRGVSVTLVVCEEEGGLTRRRRRRRMRMQTCPPDHYRARMCPECCVPAIRQPADSNLKRDSEKTVELLACLWADCKNCPSAKGLE